MVRIFLRGGAVIEARLAHWKCEHSDGRITRFTWTNQDGWQLGFMNLSEIVAITEEED